MTEKLITVQIKEYKWSSDLFNEGINKFIFIYIYIYIYINNTK